MDDLEHELDLRHHKGLDPDVYYRCPTSESLDGALQNELERSASSLIPTEIVTEFVFAVASTMTIPVIQQPHLEALLQPADFLQSITVEYALCSNIDGKDRLKIQRAVARSVVDAIQGVDRFRYIERRAQNREGSDGARFSFICQDSTQNSNRKRNLKKETTQDSIESDDQNNKDTQPTSNLYDCNGAVYVKFSLRRAAINVVYKHNPIHGRASDSDSDLPALATEAHGLPNAQSEHASSTVKKRKRKSKNKADLETNGDSILNGSTSIETPKSSKKSKKKKNGTERSGGSLTSPIAKKGKKSRASQSPLSSRIMPPLP